MFSVFRALNDFLQWRIKRFVFLWITSKNAFNEISKKIYQLTVLSRSVKFWNVKKQRFVLWVFTLVNNYLFQVKQPEIDLHILKWKAAIFILWLFSNYHEENRHCFKYEKINECVVWSSKYDSLFKIESYCNCLVFKI